MITDMIVKDVNRNLSRIYGKLRAQGYTVTRCDPPGRDGCNVCGDRTKGPWVISAAATADKKRMIAILFVAVLCNVCHHNPSCIRRCASDVAGRFTEINRIRNCQGSN